MADQFRFSVKIMPPPHNARAGAPPSPQKPLAQFMIGSNPRETFEDVWKKIQTSFENSYNVDITGQSWFHKLQTAEGFDIVVSKDKVGSLGYGPQTPSDQLKLVMLTNPIDREGSLAFTSALRPNGFKRPRLSSDAEQRSKRQRHEEERYGARIQDIDNDFPVNSRESIAHDAEQWAKDDEGFTIPRARQLRESPPAPPLRAESFQTTFSRRSESRELPEPRANAETPFFDAPRQPLPLSAPIDFEEQGTANMPLEADDDYDRPASPVLPDSAKRLLAQTSAILESQLNHNALGGPPTPVSAEESHRAPTSAQRARPSPPSTGGRGLTGSAFKRLYSAQATPARGSVETQSVRSGGAIRAEPTKKHRPDKWSEYEDELLIESFQGGMTSKQAVLRLHDLGFARTDGSIRSRKKELVNKGLLSADLTSSQIVPKSSPAAPVSVVNSSPAAQRQRVQQAPGTSKRKALQTPRQSNVQTRLPFTAERSAPPSTGKGKGRADDQFRPSFTAVNAQKKPTEDQRAFASMLETEDVAEEQSSRLPEGPAIVSIASSPASFVPPLPGVGSDDDDVDGIDTANDRPASTYGSSIFNQRSQEQAATVPASSRPRSPTPEDNDSIHSYSVPDSIPATAPEQQEARTPKVQVSSQKTRPSLFSVEYLLGKRTNGGPAKDAAAHDSDEGAEDGIEQPIINEDMDDEARARAENAAKKKLFHFSTRPRDVLHSGRKSKRTIAAASDIPSTTEQHRSMSPEQTRAVSKSNDQWKNVYKTWGRECESKVRRESVARATEAGKSAKKPNETEAAHEFGDEEEADGAEAASEEDDNSEDPAEDNATDVKDTSDHQLQSYKLLEMHDAVDDPIAKPDTFVSDDEEIEDDEEPEESDPSGAKDAQAEAIEEVSSEEESEDDDNSDGSDEGVEISPSKAIATPAKPAASTREASQTSSASLPTPPPTIWQSITSFTRGLTTSATETAKKGDKQQSGLSRLRKSAMNAHIPPVPKNGVNKSKKAVVEIPSDESSGDEA